MQLPFLKNKFPRVQKDPSPETLINGDASDHVEDKCSEELIEACTERDAKKFRNALEALCLNLFDWEGEDDAGQ